MNIFITGYSTCCINKSGGIKTRVCKIFELLSKQKNISVEYFQPMKSDLNSCDILHLFKLMPEYYNLVLKAKDIGVKVVLSSVVPLCGGWKIIIFRKFINKVPILTEYKMQQRILEMVDSIIVESKREKDFIAKYYGISPDKMTVIPNGIETATFVDANDDIYHRIGGKKKYVLQVGRVDANKNVINVIKALKNTEIDYVIVGGADVGNSTYYNKCLKEAEGNEKIHFLGWVDNNSDLLKSAYSNAQVLVLPSYNETFGLVALEGAAAGCNIAITNSLPIHDFHIFDDCWLFDPSDIKDIKEKVVSAFNTEKNGRLVEKLTGIFSWDAIIDKHLSLYRSLLDIKQ